MQVEENKSNVEEASGIWKERLHELTKGEHQIDKDFRDCIKGAPWQSLNPIPDIAWNGVFPPLLSAVANKELTNLQVLKAVCISMQKSINFFIQGRHNEKIINKEPANDTLSN